MTKHLFISVLASTLILAGFTACGPNANNSPTDPIDPVEPPVEHFERTMLLEQFTGERCPNCPNGVLQIDAWLKQHPNVVWVGHHAGYSDDQWTISDSKTIARYLGVSGAPFVALDRIHMVANENGLQYSGYNLHPYYLNYLTELPSAITSASIRLYNTYDNGKLQIHVTGALKEEAPDSMRLTVMIKENGLHGKQQDQFYTLAGSWDDYIHSNVVRTFVSTVGGDTLVPDSSTYEKDYELQLDPKWVPEHCMVVAFLTDMQSINVIQAAEKPVVEGTTGGADLPHGGVTPKPVAEGYPEGKYSISEFLKSDTVFFEQVQVSKSTPANGVREWTLRAWTTAQTYGSGQNISHPFCEIIFFTDATVSTPPISGEYPLQVARNQDEFQANTAWAGYCDLDAQKVVGSELLMVSKSLFDAGNISPVTNGRWLIASGTLSFREDGFSVNATSAKGYPILLEYSMAD